MGTSSSSPSPRTVNWNAVTAGYRDDRVAIDRIVQEIWRAAQRPDEGNWGRLLSEPIVGRLFGIVQSSESPQQATTLAARAIAESRSSSLATDVARRAIVQAFAGGDKSRNFVESLFAEASNYLVSRDLASFVGPGNRNQTVSASIEFKRAIHRQVREVVRAADAAAIGQAGSWEEAVRVALGRLTTS